MTNAIADHRGKGDVYGLIVSALGKMSKPLNGLTLEDLAPVDHFHARGFPATVELGDRLPIRAGQRILDIGCGLGGPARYIANRFQCSVSGLDITEPLVQAASKLTALLRMQDKVQIQLGDGQQLPYPDSAFDGAYTQHVTINVADRPRFFAEAYRVLKPGASSTSGATTSSSVQTARPIRSSSRLSSVRTAVPPDHSLEWTFAGRAPQ